MVISFFSARIKYAYKQSIKLLLGGVNVKTNAILGALLAVAVIISLGLGYAVIDQRAMIGDYKTGSGGIRTYSAQSESGWGSVRAAEEVQENTLFVSGAASASADPEKVTIIMSVETESLSASSSQQDNAQKMATVRGALVSSGIEADSIETVSYTLGQIREYNQATRKYEYKGFKTTHTLKVDVENIDNAGSVIDAGVSAGVNVVNSVSFGLSDETIDELKMQALEAAAKSAREKADAIGRGLGISVTRVLSASEGYAYSPSVSTYNMAGDAAAGSAAEPTEITPGSISITANVNVVFETA